MLPAPNVLFPSDPQTEYTVVFCLQICLGDDPAELVNAGELFRHGNMDRSKKRIRRRVAKSHADFSIPVGGI